MVDKPTIVTNDMVLSQQIGINSVRGIRGGHDDHQTEELFHRRDENIMAGDESGDKSGVGDNRQLQQKPSYPLTMRFTMKYGTRVGVPMIYPTTINYSRNMSMPIHKGCVRT